MPERNTPANDENRWLTGQEEWRKLTFFAKQMRAEPTEAELILWRELRRGQIGVRFRRQVLIGPFIVDFYCGRARLAIEMDGEVHADQRQYDRAREPYLRDRGVTVLRFRNEQVLEHLVGVLDQIKGAVADRQAGDG